MEYTEETNGSTYQSKLPTLADVEDFSDQFEPHRRLIGRHDREFFRVSLTAELDFEWGALISVTGYNDIEQSVESSICWDDPDDPQLDADPVTPGAQVECLFGVAFFPTLGSAAGPGETVDQLFASLDNFETFNQDLRLVSPGDQRLRWMVGASYMDRETLTGFDAGLILGPASGDSSNCATGFGFDPSQCGGFTNLFPAWDVREDSWWGIYGQVSYDVTDKLELTLAGRYDDQEYTNTRFTDRNKTAIVQVLEPVTGILIDSEVNDATDFQPKITLSYDVTPDFMAYFTWSQGFRAGFYNTGNFTVPEDTKNIEGGIKSTFDIFETTLVANLAVFYIDYSDQQFSTTINDPPFRIPITIPSSDIYGLEIESTWFINKYLSLGGAFGYLDAKLPDGTTPPNAPEFTVNLMGDFQYPLGDRLTGTFHVDYRYDDAMFLGAGETSRTSHKEYVNLRLGVEYGNWTTTFFAKNVTDERSGQTAFDFLAAGFIRNFNKPRQLGVEVMARF